MAVIGVPIGSNIPAPSSPTAAIGFTYSRAADDTIQAGVAFRFRLIDSKGDDSLSRLPVEVVSDSDGLIAFQVRKGATYEARRGEGPWISFDVPEDDADLDEGKFRLPPIPSEITD